MTRCLPSTASTAWRRSSERRTTTEPVHARPLGVDLRVFALLVGSERLVEGSVCLGMGRNRLSHQAADAAGRLVDRGAVVLRHARLQGVVRRLHLIMQRLFVARCIVENVGCLLLLGCS